MPNVIIETLLGDGSHLNGKRNSDYTCDWECKKACKIDEYLDIKYCSCENGPFGKLVLACEQEMFNTTELPHLMIKK